MTLEQVQEAARAAGASMRYTCKRVAHEVRLKLRHAWDWEAAGYELSEVCRLALRWLADESNDEREKGR